MENEGVFNQWWVRLYYRLETVWCIFLFFIKQIMSMEMCVQLLCQLFMVSSKIQSPVIVCNYSTCGECQTIVLPSISMLCGVGYILAEQCSFPRTTSNFTAKYIRVPHSHIPSRTYCVITNYTTLCFEVVFTLYYSCVNIISLHWPIVQNVVYIVGWYSSSQMCSEINCAVDDDGAVCDVDRRSNNI